VRICALALLLVVGAITAGCGGGNDHNRKVLFPAGCTNPSYKPTQIIVTCADANTVLKGISWKSYGSDRATGSATANVNACDPNCAAGKLQTFPATVKLSQPKDCRKDVRQFTHLVLTYTGASPQGASASLTEDYPCNGP
jgi:Flp pilus assembly protein TadG